ncbi:FAD-dependent oxidoreductase [Variovorax sp. J22R133]|uniref:FAD-dependent oxidoreductase n=1 Tax=Variovorax brevis TaxID=3053503 RepID=UPI0025757C59|nr:FAD-dependent oxidoreductase [Variovorax sp. J22R133]MDM0111776.1 FAD-dependent oxidoreductase [Variovorax sp. J22R133]
MRRRGFLGAGVGAMALSACDVRPPIEGGFTGIDMARGHAMRDAEYASASSASVKRTQVVISGGGIAGLAAARALRLQGIDDFVLLELEDSAGGNSRGGIVQNIACPLGAHYLPVPGDDASEVQDLLEELGLRRRVAGRWEYDERHLCHSPQERLYFQGQWQEGLLPVQGVTQATLDQYHRFAQRVDALRKRTRFSIPVAKVPLAPEWLELDAISFAAWLDRENLGDTHLRWYLDYCCRDDYGAGIAHVSAWAGIHYFASRHGFHAPGSDDNEERDPVLTWPEGNAWLARRMAAPLGERLRTGHVVMRIEETRSGVEVDAFDVSSQAPVRWQAERCIVALPVFIAARVVIGAPRVLREAAERLRYAPWLVANVHVRAPLADRPGAAPSWDNVLYGSRGLGYVDARHQSLSPAPGATVLTWYRPLGPSGHDGSDGRRALQDRSWATWRNELLAEMGVPHPDLAHLATRIDITRYGHAMAIPSPGLLRHIGIGQRRIESGRLAFAHADWSGYSIFEEAFTRGHFAA